MEWRVEKKVGRNNEAKKEDLALTRLRDGKFTYAPAISVLYNRAHAHISRNEYRAKKESKTLSYERVVNEYTDDIPRQSIPI